MTRKGRIALITGLAIAAAGVAVTFVVRDQVSRARRDLFSPHSLRRLAALSHLRSAPASVDLITLETSTAGVQAVMLGVRRYGPITLLGLIWTVVAWVWSPGWLEMMRRVHVRPRRTFDSSATPKAGENPAAVVKNAAPAAWRERVDSISVSSTSRTT